MSVRQIPEVAIDLIIDHIRTNIPTELASLITDRNDPYINNEIPFKYYLSEFDAFESPAIFVMCQQIDFQKEAKGANYINAKCMFNIHCICEDRTENILVRKIYRYMAALHSVLDQTALTSLNGKLKLELIVERASFSPVFTAKEDRGEFRKELLLECSAFCYENF